jgi:hypothetical protein
MVLLTVIKIFPIGADKRLLGRIMVFGAIGYICQLAG